MRTLFGKRAICTLALGVWFYGPTEGAVPPATNQALLVRIEIERMRVESSSLVSVGFSREARILEIEFRSGAIYRYQGVPLAVFEGMKKAESKGRYFAQFIRGKYEFQRVEVLSK